jgi:hypothetical protein
MTTATTELENVRAANAAIREQIADLDRQIKQAQELSGRGKCPIPTRTWPILSVAAISCTSISVVLKPWSYAYR